MSLERICADTPQALRELRHDAHDEPALDDLHHERLRGLEHRREHETDREQQRQEHDGLNQRAERDRVDEHLHRQREHQGQQPHAGGVHRDGQQVGAIRPDEVVRQPPGRVLVVQLEREGVGGIHREPGVLAVDAGRARGGPPAEAASATRAGRVHPPRAPGTQPLEQQAQRAVTSHAQHGAPPTDPLQRHVQRRLEGLEREAAMGETVHQLLERGALGRRLGVQPPPRRSSSSAPSGMGSLTTVRG
jgi:hypothetical protein